MFPKILVALDNSDLSREVFYEALALAKTTQAELLLLHVLTSTDEGYPDITAFPEVASFPPNLYEEAMQRYAQQWETFEQYSEARLRALVQEAETAGVKADFTQFLGSPGSIICSMARTWKADLIMIGRRGRQGVNELLLGSVSNYVMHHAGCSVLIVQGKLPVQFTAIEEKQTAKV